MAALALAVGVSHAVEAALRYELVDEPLHHGSRGIELATFAPRDARPRVALLGNSVYRLYGIAPLLRELSASEGRPLDVVNLAQVGCGIDDHVVQARKALEAEPDLIVVGLIDLTFSTYAPTFRTSADTLLGEPAYLRALPGSFLRRHLGWSQALNAGAMAALPLARLDPIVRHQWAESPAGPPRWLSERLRFPTLNQIHDTFDDSLLGYPIDYATYPPYAWSAQAAAELQAAAGDVPVLWIWQETGSQPPWTDALAAKLRGVAEASPRARFVDLRDQYTPGRFQDAVHPLPEEREPYARRHLQAILSALPAER